MRAALGAAALALVVIPTAVATAEPTSSDAEQTISRLESEGYDVIVDRVGSGDLSRCEVTGVRHPQTLTQTIVRGHDHNREVVTVIVSKSIHVTLDCGV